MIKSDSNDISIVTKDFYFQYMLFFWTFYLLKYHSFHKNTKPHNYF